MDEVLGRLGALIAEIEQLLQGAADAGGQYAEGASEQLRNTVARLREQLGQTERSVQHLRGQVRRSARDADRYVRENPWRTAGVAAGAAFLLGLLLARRD